MGGQRYALFDVERNLLVVVVPLFAHQVLGIYGQGCDKHQHPGENDFLYSSDKDWLKVITYRQRWLFPFSSANAGKEKERDSAALRLRHLGALPGDEV
jgi:hypothetical protein